MSNEKKEEYLLVDIAHNTTKAILIQDQNIKEIAEALCISPKTVESHKYNIMEKLNVSSIAHLTKIALRKDLIDL